MVTCKLCGACCWYQLDGMLKKCKHLVKLSNGKTLCRIYNKRLGTIIDTDKDGKKTVCMLREQHNVNYDGCPFNGGK